MEHTFAILSTYLARVLPGLVLGAALLGLTRKMPRMRIPIYLLLFVLLRDALTPLRLWQFDANKVFWLRLYDDGRFLTLFGLSSAFLVFVLQKFDQTNREYLVWIRGNWVWGTLLGLAGAALVVLPIFFLSLTVPLEIRGGSVNNTLLPAIFVFALLGNLLEETLFRGYVLNSLAKHMPLFQAGIGSGIVFAFCHSFLAITVSDVGIPLLLFTLWEGIIAGLVGARYGIFCAALTHGGAIFILAAGLF